MTRVTRSSDSFWNRSSSNTDASSRSSSPGLALSSNVSVPAQPAGHSARRKIDANPSGKAGARAASAGGTSAKPLNGGPPMNLEPVTNTIASRFR